MANDQKTPETPKPEPQALTPAESKAVATYFGDDVKVEHSRVLQRGKTTIVGEFRVSFEVEGRRQTQTLLRKIPTA